MKERACTEELEAMLPAESSPLAVARIDEAACIGCTLCIAACPVDAIVGSARLMHTVLTEHCTGCKLCLPPCPVDCIAMVAAGRDWTRSDAGNARTRFARRKARIATARSRDQEHAALPGPDPEKIKRRAAVTAALARARARRAQHSRRPR